MHAMLGPILKTQHADGTQRATDTSFQTVRFEERNKEGENKEQSTHQYDLQTFKQGYCCSCSLGEIIGISDEQSRAALDCSLFGSDSSSAHCLRFDDLWYDVFEVGQAQIYYDITVSILRFDEGSQTYVQEDIILSPSKTIATSSGKEIVARLIGDFAPFQQYPVFEEKLLMVASQPPEHPRVTAGVQDWMIVSKTLVELSGLECNKIGVSFEGFRTESGACRNRVGSCLRNQLEDFYQADSLKRSQGKVGDYFLSVYGTFVPLLSADHNRYIALQVDQIQNSVITLVFSADDIRFITNAFDCFSPFSPLRRERDQMTD